jgi:hypothetical protein
VGEEAVTANARQRLRFVLLPLAVPFVILAAVAVYAVVVPLAPTRDPAPGSRGALVWGDGIFANRVELKAWFALHGGNYEAFAASHPHALKLLAARSRRAHPGRTALKSRPLPRPTASTNQVSSGGSQPSTHSLPTAASTLFVVLVCLGLLLGVAAAFPRRLLLRLPIADDEEFRVLSAAGGFSILLGVIVATQLS